jgi:two-component system, NarL family, response regulator YdfI
MNALEEEKCHAREIDVKAPGCVVTILIVDEMVPFRRWMRLFLENSCCCVVGEAESGREAVRMANLEKPDIILMNYALEDMSGLEATRLIKSNGLDSKVAILAPKSRPSIFADCILAGAFSYIFKPGFCEVLGIAGSIMRKRMSLYSGVR